MDIPRGIVSSYVRRKILRGRVNWVKLFFKFYH